jgi:hypothetical protein
MTRLNRAHYRLETHIGYDKWTPTEEFLCVFHARRISRDGYRLAAIRAGRYGMSRPYKLKCSTCSKDHSRCEHDAQKTNCPRIPGDTCGRDSDRELGGSW